ncbi:glycosyltransferase family 2 protein [Rhodopila sp.]|uniref:glycosyltransferase family 2 protein n=1 Tax=Rhodopila sp. TaxID=2480087 RepID=UPI003D11AD15
MSLPGAPAAKQASNVTPLSLLFGQETSFQTIVSPPVDISARPVTIRHVAGAGAPPVGRYDVDMIMLSLDRVEDTIAAIRSALGQTGLSAHLTILDQGSRPQALDRLAAEVRGRTDATLLAADGNLGVAGGRNLTSGQGHGRVIVALDNDAEFATADTVARMLIALDAEPRLAAVGCRIVTHADGRDDIGSWGYPNSLLPCAGECFDTVTYVGAGHALRRTAWEQAGGYDGTLFFCWEEFDFCLRAIALGWRVRYRGDIVIRHKVSAERRVAWSADRWFYFVRNRLYIELKLGRRWAELAPRAMGYLLKGLRNGLLIQTLRALSAARGMAPRKGSRNGSRMLPRAAAAYVARNDKAHRGSFVTRIRHEVLGRLRHPQGAVAASDR